MLFVVGKISPDFRDYLEEHAIPYGLFAARRTSKAPAETYLLDFSTPASIRASLHALNPRPAVDAVITTGYEHFVEPAAVIADYFGVPGLSPAAARAATDKITMREKFIAYDAAITPDFAPVGDWNDIEQFLQTHALPVMLKPANLMKSLFISKNHTRAELKENYEQMLGELPAVYARLDIGEPRILIEECLVGTMHTVAGFVDTNGTFLELDDVADCITAQDIGRSDNYLFSRHLPSTLSEEYVQALKDTARAGIAALGLTSTPIHAELMLTSDGAKIIEIGARNGGYRPRMYHYANGIDLYQATLDVAYGKLPDLAPQSHQACIVLELFAETTGSFTGLDGSRISALPSCQYYRTAKIGSITGRAADGYRAPVIIMLAGSDTQQVQRDAEWIQKSAHISVDTP